MARKFRSDERREPALPRNRPRADISPSGSATLLRLPSRTKRMPSLLPTEFTEAYGRFWPAIRAKCRRMLGSGALADEIAQEAFVRLWEAGPQLDGRGETRTIMAWLYVTSTRLAVDALRQGKRVTVDDAATESAAAPGSLANVAAARSSIAALVRHVGAEELEAAVLTRVDGLSQTEAATLLGVTDRTVRRLLDRFDEQSGALRDEVAHG